MATISEGARLISNRKRRLARAAHTFVDVTVAHLLPRCSRGRMPKNDWGRS